MKMIEYWDREGNKRDLPIKQLDEVSCDRRDCSVFGNYWKCYNANQNRCTLYQNWMKECDKLRE